MEQALPQARPQEKIPLLIRLTKLYWETAPLKSIGYGETAINLSEKYAKMQQLATSLLYTAVAKYYIGEYDSCIYFSKRATVVVPHDRLQPTISFASNLLSISYKQLGRYDSALKYARITYHIRAASTDTVNIAGALDNLSHIYIEKGEYDEALSYSLKALTLFEKVHDTVDEAMTLAGMANMYLDLNKTNLSLQTFQSAEALLSKNKNTTIYADVIFNIGSIYLKQKKYDLALQYFESSKLIYQKKGVKSGMAEANQSLGLCYAGKKVFAQAIKRIRQADTYYQKIGNLAFECSSQQALGKVFLQYKRFDSAEFYLQKAYAISRKIDKATNIKESLKLLSDVYAQKGSVKAYTYYKKYIRYRDSIEGQETKLKLAELQTKYETAKKDKKILHLMVAEKQARLRNQWIINIFVIVLVLLGALMLFLAVRRRNERVMARQMNIITRKNESIAKAKMEKSDLEAKHLESELNYKTKQLATHSLSMMQKSKMLYDMSQSVQEIMRSEENQRNKLLNQLNLQLTHILKSDNDWGLFKRYFEDINRHFFTELKQRFPDLTENEVRLSALIKMNLNLKETASVLNISPNSVKNARYRLKEKLKLDGVSLNDFIHKIGE